MRSTELERARHAQECLNQLGGDMLAKYSDRLKGAPAQLMENGLLQVLAFFHSKQGEYAVVAENLEDWLRRRDLLPRNEEPLGAVVRLDAAAYRRCSEEAIAWLNAAKRLAAARVMARAAGGTP